MIPVAYMDPKTRHVWHHHAAGDLPVYPIDPKVLEQALEALEASRAYVDPRMLPGHDAAIRALREALA